jgi:hypothetical protein
MEIDVLKSESRPKLGYFQQMKGNRSPSKFRPPHFTIVPRGPKLLHSHGQFNSPPTRSATKS